MRGALLFVGNKVHACKAGDLAFQIAIIDRCLEAVLFAGGPVIVHTGASVLREVAVRRGRAGIFSRAELRERRSPVAFLDFGENGAGVARSGQNLDGLAVDVSAQISGSQRVRSRNKRGVLRNLCAVVLGDESAELRRGNAERGQSFIKASHC